MRNKRAVMILGLAFVSVHLAIVFAGFVAAYDPGAQNRACSYAPPTRVHFSIPQDFTGDPLFTLRCRTSTRTTMM